MTTFGEYLRCERETEGLSVWDVAESLAVLGLCGFNRVWPSNDALFERLEQIEAGGCLPVGRQLLSLRLVLPSLLLDKARRLIAEDREAQNG